MHPILFQWGPLTIYSYGVMMACAFIIGTYLAQKEAALQAVDSQKIVDLTLWLVLFGIVGARLLYVLQNLAFYRVNPLEIIMLQRGGLSYFGGFLSALLCAVLFLRKNGLPVWKVLDILAPFLALGQAVGRIGCLLNGCCFGKPSSFCLSLDFPGDPVARYPVQVCSSLLLLLLFLLLRRGQISARGKKLSEGKIFLLYCCGYSLIRFLLEFIRGDHQVLLFGLTVYQYISAGIFIIAGSLLWKRKTVLASKSKKEIAA